MNFERFIASRILKGSGQSRFSKPIVRIATIGIAVGMAVMILSLAIMNGFKSEIREKAVGFGAHIQMIHFSTNNSLEADPVTIRQTLADSLSKYEGVKHVQPFGAKAGIIKAGDELQGVVLKGVSKNFDWSFFQNNLREGKTFTLSDTGTSDQALISRTIADKMKLTVGKKFRMYFIQDKRQRVRVFKVSGIYQTGMEGFDDVYVLGDMRHVQRLNQWEENQAAGYEVLVNDYRQLEEITDEIRNSLPAELNTVNVRESNPQIFSWLDVIDVNAVIIIGLMLFVGVFNMISALIIIIIEHTSTIGVLKALGSSNWGLEKIFLHAGARLIGRGMIAGNIIGLGLAFLQQKFHLVPLDQESYYVSTVPIRFDWLEYAGLNGLCLLVCILSLLLPALVVLGITPVRAIRFS
ncbi:MAG: lipoprotein release ABC transporter permease [Bacteroidetes bacterium]|nr:MAG: lipoprotein release ABC transporter permease [Bacteroidota bacterium]